MIPPMIDTYLREHRLRFEHHVHRRVIPAQRLAAAEHVTGARVAKVVVVSVDGNLALAVVPAPAHADPAALCQALHAHEVKVVTEDSFADVFWPCEVGAEPPLSVFGLPIYVDADLARQPRLLMRAGTHEDSILVDTDDWLVSERVRIVKDLGLALH